MTSSPVRIVQRRKCENWILQREDKASNQFKVSIFRNKVISNALQREGDGINGMTRRGQRTFVAPETTPDAAGNYSITKTLHSTGDPWQI
jgi:hypothetical protein